jgi:hypothetical protein
VDPGGGNVVTVEQIGIVEDDIERELARGREPEDVGASEAADETEEETDRP